MDKTLDYWHFYEIKKAEYLKRTGGSEITIAGDCNISQDAAEAYKEHHINKLKEVIKLQEELFSKAKPPLGEPKSVFEKWRLNQKELCNKLTKLKQEAKL